MKKTISMILVLALLFMIQAITASAIEKESIDPQAKEKFLPKLYEQYEFLPPEEYLTLYSLEEVYTHKDESGAIDWSLIHFSYETIKEHEIVQSVLGSRSIYLSGPEYPFTIRYGLYDEKNACFVNLWENSTTVFEQYDGLYDAWLTLDLTDISPDVLIGDANGDQSLDITDATHIQRYLADIVNKYTIDTSLADYDKDNDTTILDATAIQRHLAGLPTNENIAQPIT